MNKEIKFIPGGVLLEKVDLGDLAGSPQDLEVRWDSGGVHINSTGGLNLRPGFFGAILRKLTGAPLVFANPDPFPSGAPDCTQMGGEPRPGGGTRATVPVFELEEDLSKLPEEQLLARIALLGKYLSPGVEVKIIPAPVPTRAFGEHAKIGDAPPATGKKSKKEKTPEPPPETSFQQDMQQLDKDTAVVKTSHGNIPVEQIMTLLTVPPLDPNVGLLGKRKEGWFSDSVLMRLTYGFAVAVEQKEAAAKAGASYDARGWLPLTPPTPYFNREDAKVGAEDFIAICLAVHENHPGKIAPLDVRLSPEGGKQMFIDTVREKFAENAKKKSAAK